jgi:hypothetical protein
MKSNIEELQEVENRLKYEKELRMYERYQTIRLYLMGYLIKGMETTPFDGFHWKYTAAINSRLFRI